MQSYREQPSHLQFGLHLLLLFILLLLFFLYFLFCRLWFYFVFQRLLFEEALQSVQTPLAIKYNFLLLHTFLVTICSTGRHCDKSISTHSILEEYLLVLLLCKWNLSNQYPLPKLYLWSIHRSVIANHNVWSKQLVLTSTDSHFISFVMRLSSLKNSIIGNPNFVALFLNFSKSAGPLTLSTKDGIRSRANDFTVGDISLIVIRHQVLAFFFIYFYMQI